MATNRFFNTYMNVKEQDLLDSLVAESIQIHGEDMYFIPRVINNYDHIYGTDDQSSYTTPYEIEIYIESINGFSGDGNFMSNFGLQIRDQVIFSVNQNRFKEAVGIPAGQSRPNEGDIIYFPLNNKCFQIKYVDPRQMFYQLGATYTYLLTCELFEYSGEKFATGIEAIDQMMDLSLNEYDYALKDQNGTVLTDQDGDPVVETYSIEGVVPDSDNEDLQHESDQIANKSDPDPFQFGKY